MLINMDLQGAEWIVVAYLCRDESMLEVVRSGKSPHAVTGSRLSGLSEELVIRENKLIGDTTNANDIAEIRRNKIPEVLTAKFLPRALSIRQAGKKCLVGDTEVLTIRGWRKISEISRGELVVQWDQGLLSYEPALETFRYENTEPLIALRNNRFSQIVTKNHRLPVRDNKKHTWGETIAENLPDTTRFCLPLTGVLQNTGESFLTAAETRLLVAVQADGSISPYGYVTFQVHKERKAERLRAILAELGISVRVDANKHIHLPRCPVVDKLVKCLSGFVYERQERHTEKTPRRGNLQKLFGDYLLRLGSAEVKAFVDELPFWDGHAKFGKKSHMYFTTVGHNAEWAHTMAHLCGYRASLIRREPSRHGFGKKPMYFVDIGKVDNTTVSTVERTIAQAPEVFCLTVPSGFFMVRHDGKISITGNSNHGLNYDEGYKTFALTNEMDERDAKTIVDLYKTRVYPGIPKWHASTREALEKTRTLTNCFGRKCYFMGQLGNDTYKQGYAFVPQSTVVDITNRAMPLMMRDDSRDFEPARLLAQVHDSLLTEYLSRDFHAMARFAIKLGLDYLRPELNYGEPFRLNVDMKVGLDWGTMREIKLTPDADALAEKLREAWEEFSGKRKAA